MLSVLNSTTAPPHSSSVRGSVIFLASVTDL